MSILGIRTAADRLRDLEAASSQRIASLEEQLVSVRDYAARQARLAEDRTSDLEDKLAREVGWTVLGDNALAASMQKARNGYNGTFTDEARRVRRFRTSKRIVNMHGEYCFGPGVEAPTTGDDKLDRLLLDWWTYGENQSVAFSMVAQHRLSAKLLVDGVLYFACFAPSGARPMLVRLLKPEEIASIVTHPEDASKVLYYQRKYRPKRFNTATGSFEASGDTEVTYYQDIDFTEDGEFDDPYIDGIGDRLAVDGASRQPVRVLRVAYNALDPTDAGQGIMLDMMDMELEILRISEDQSTISASTAGLMNRLYVQGGSKQVSAAVSHFGQLGSDPSTAPLNAGDINVMSAGAKLDVSRANTGATDARQNHRLFLMQLVTGGGVAMHYAGDPENANLATASAMEGPQLKHFEAYQGLWTYIYTRLATAALQWAGEDVSDLNINVPMPDIVVANLLDRLEAIGMMDDRGWATWDQSAREAWITMGAADPTAEVEIARQEKEEQEKADEEAPDVSAAMQAAMNAAQAPAPEEPIQPAMGQEPA